MEYGLEIVLIYWGLFVLSAIVIIALSIHEKKQEKKERDEFRKAS